MLQPIIKKLGGFEKFKRELTRCAAGAAVDDYISQSLNGKKTPPAPTKPAPGAIRKATDKSTTRPSSKH